ncbi:2'-deoxycytidine 5'-triphosphate deaminase [Candidatus Parcubacteria bacterium]|nr:MAG: 2'-deoxycytidine 5'-triphosphate deaminase [Candidatus Parcubacteria bacterium]
MKNGANKKGALSSRMIREYAEKGFIQNINPENIRPSSLDLSISDEIYRVQGIFQPRPGEKIVDLLKSVEHAKHDLSYPLEKDVMYLAKLEESLALPKNIYAYCNPKSSTGRTDTHVRVLTDGISRYDAVPQSGYEGSLWAAITPKSFPIKISGGETLSQIRFFNWDTRFSEDDLEKSVKKDKLLWDIFDDRPLDYDELKISDRDGSIILTLDLKSKIVGYKCSGSNKILDFSKIKHYSPEDFFEPIVKRNDHLYLNKGEFYILSTREALRVPPSLSCEMIPMDERSGEFRSHYAGFIDPGWGWGAKGEGRGRTITLELRPFEDLVVRDKQPIGKIRFERMIEIPDMVYDKIGMSNYTSQNGPKLSKHFKTL